MKFFTITVLTLGLTTFVLLYVVFGHDFFGVPEAKTLPVQASRTNLKADVSALFNTPEPRSVLHLKSLNLAADHIKTEWEKLGLTVTEQMFHVGGDEFKNLIVSFGPAKGKRYVIGAHYDVCEEEASNARGADDNASGVASLLELSRLLVKSKVTLTHRLDLIAWTLEEPPHYATPNMGSAVHAKFLKGANIEVGGMISLEMLGYYSDKPESQEFPFAFLKYFYPSVGNFIMVAGNIPSFGWNQKIKEAFQRYSKVPIASISAPAFIRGIQFSDHRNYGAEGFHSTMLTDTAFYRNHNYHQSTDTPNTLNYEKMAEIVNGLYGLVTDLSD